MHAAVQAVLLQLCVASCSMHAAPPQVGGMSYAFNHSLLAGERLLGAWLKDNEPLLEHSGPILLLTNDYVGLSGGDG